MSFRTSLLQQSRSRLVSTNPAIARSFATTPARRASAGHDDHSHSHGSTAGEEDVYTSESYLSPAWRNTFILLTASILIYPYLPSRPTSASSPSLSPDTFAQTSKDTNAPYVTRLLAKITPEAKVWTERNEKHLELSKEAADTKLLFQEAERPRVWRMRNPASFESASPHGIPVGSQIDLSDLKVRTE